MRPEVSVLLAGVGGYGRLYLDALRADAARHGARLAATVDPAGPPPGGGAVPHFPSLAAALGSVSADLVVLCTPIHRHAEDAVLALRAGCHVLCEKPLAGGRADADRMVAAARRSDRFLAIGYQWSFAPAVLRLKEAVRAGRFGRPVAFRARTDWPRGARYYARNAWAGRLRTPDGAVVNDGPANNAAAHHLHLMLFLLGEAPDRSADVARVEALQARANPIEGGDTAALRVTTRAGVPLLYLATHAVAQAHGPEFALAFERGALVLGPQERRFRFAASGGAVEDWGDPDEGGPMAKLWRCVACVRDGTPPPLGAEGARAQTLVADALLAGADRIVTVPPAATALAPLPDGDTVRFVPGLAACFAQAFAAGALPGESGVPAGPWAPSRDRVTVECAP